MLAIISCNRNAMRHKRNLQHLVAKLSVFYMQTYADPSWPITWMKNTCLIGLQISLSLCLRLCLCLCLSFGLWRFRSLFFRRDLGRRLRFGLSLWRYLGLRASEIIWKQHHATLNENVLQKFNIDAQKNRTTNNKVAMTTQTKQESTKKCFIKQHLQRIIIVIITGPLCSLGLLKKKKIQLRFVAFCCSMIKLSFDVIGFGWIWLKSPPLRPPLHHRLQTPPPILRLERSDQDLQLLALGGHLPMDL